MKKIFLLALLITIVSCSAMAESMVLTQGFYVVGQDIKAGGYDIIVGEFGAEDSGWCAVYSDRDKMENNEKLISGSIPLGAEPFHVNLEEGNVLVIEDLPLLFSDSGITKENYPQYTAPEGTLVVGGIYRGGIDIPVGIYQVYPSSITAGYIVGYRTEEAYQKDKDSSSHMYRDFTVEYFPTKPEQISVVEVEEGNVLIFNGSAIMRKPEKLIFE